MSYERILRSTLSKLLFLINRLLLSMIITLSIMKKMIRVQHSVTNSDYDKGLCKEQMNDKIIEKVN